MYSKEMCEIYYIHITYIPAWLLINGVSIQSMNFYGTKTVYNVWINFTRSLLFLRYHNYVYKVMCKFSYLPTSAYDRPQSARIVLVPAESSRSTVVTDRDRRKVDT